MDPASVVGIIGVVGQIIKAIYQYGDGISECRSEVARLRAELFGIQAALTQVERDLTSTCADGSSSLASPNLRSQDSCRVLEEARLLLVPLAETLSEGISRADRLAKRLSWPFKRQQMQDIATHLERLKTYFILAATNDTLQATKETAASLESLRLSMEEVKRSENQRVVETEAYEWLDPFDTNSTHNAALSAHLDGTSGWFLDDVLSNWLLEDSQVLWLRGRPGSGKTCLMAASVARYVAVRSHCRTSLIICYLQNGRQHKERHYCLLLLLFQSLSIARASDHHHIAYWPAISARFSGARSHCQFLSQISDIAQRSACESRHFGFD